MLVAQARRKCAYADAYSPDATTPRNIQCESRGRPALLEYNPDIGLRDRNGDTPLHDILSRIEPSTEGKVVEIVRRLLEYGADPNIRRDDGSGSTPLHPSSFSGSLEVTRLLLSYGARIDEEDEEWKTPFEVASSHGHDEIMKLLLEP